MGLRMSIYVGQTMLSRREVDAVCEELGDEFRGNQYHLLARNVRPPTHVAAPIAIVSALRC